MLLRRVRGIVLVQIIFCCATTICSANNENLSPIVRVKQGLLRGIREKTVNGREFLSYLSIPYAKPPIGSLRFKDPKEADPWEDVLEASIMPEYCPQIHLLDVFRGTFNNFMGKEDCLYLNVFTPKVTDKELLPVMVFIHGGGFFCGGAKEYQPYALLDEDIVLVVINYRLSIFGFLSTEDSHMAGNFGIKDQILSLKWVKENIQNFGGNPDMVTIFGESAGSASVHSLILSPKATGLFHRAIMHSGNMLSNWAQSGGGRELASKVGAEINCPLIQDRTEDYIKCLQKLDAQELLKLSSSYLKQDILELSFGPLVDNDVLPDKPEILLKEGKYNKVDIISGNTRDEGALLMFSGAIPKLAKDDDDHFDQRVTHFLTFQTEDNPLHLTNQVYDYYLQGKPVGLETVNEVTKLIGDRMFVVYQDIAASFHARDESINVYQYTFEHRGQMSLGDFFQFEPYSSQWVSHIDDLIYLFTGGEMFGRPLQTNEDLLVRKIFLKLWTNFARTGNPTPPGSDLGFVWSRATPNDFSFLNFTANPEMVKDMRKEVRDFHSSLDTRQNRLLFPDGNTDIFSTLKSDRDEL